MELPTISNNTNTNVRMNATNTNTSIIARKRKRRSEHGCVCEENDLIVVELKKIKEKLRPMSGSHLPGNYHRAILSIQACPEVITNSKQAKELKNVGNYIANQIQCILNKHRPLQVQSSPQVLLTTRAIGPPTSIFALPSAERITQETDMSRLYIPASGKKPWLILKILHHYNSVLHENAMTIDDLYTNMKKYGFAGTIQQVKSTLAQLHSTHGVILKSHSGSLYLSEKGKESVTYCIGDLELQDGMNERVAMNINNYVPPAIALDTRTSKCNDQIDIVTVLESDSETEELPPTSLQVAQNSFAHVEIISSQFSRTLVESGWDVVLVLDHREILDRQNRGLMQRKLQEQKVLCDVRSLNIGDVQWIARHRFTLEELMLNFIVERKQIQDLAGSIVDSRYTEQKARLKACGVSNVVYLVEGSLARETNLSRSALETAMCRTQVQDDFFLKHALTADESVQFLVTIHRRIEKMILKQTQSTINHTSRSAFVSPNITFNAFNTLFSKKRSFSAMEMLQRMLMQVPGLSIAKTIALTKQYQTLPALIAILDQESASDIQENVRGSIDNLQYGESNRRVGCKVIKYLHSLLLKKSYHPDHLP